MLKNIPYYLIAAGLCVLLKFGFTLADTGDLAFLLKPAGKLVGWLTGAHPVYLADKGYYYEPLNVMIDKSCSGFNFWILSFAAFVYLGVKYCDKVLYKILTIPVALLGAYLLTVFVNASRIFASIIVQNQTKNSLPAQQHLIHEAVGIITNLSFLVLAYYITENFLKHRQYHEKLAQSPMAFHH